MKRVILLMCAVGLVACDTDSAYQERLEMRERFEQAQVALDRAVRGTDPAAADLDEDEDVFEPIARYRRQQLREAADILEPLTRSSASSDRLVAHTLLAEAAFTHGNAIIGEVSSNWNGILREHSRLLSSVSALRNANAVYEEHAAIDLSGQIEELAAEEQELLGQREEIEQAIAEIDAQIAELEGEIEQVVSQRRELDARADELSREAFAAEGEEQFDLYVEAAELKKESSLLASEVDGLEGRLSVQRSQRRLEQVRIEQIDAQVEQYREAAEELESRTRTLSELAEEASARFAEKSEHFTELLEYIMGAHREQVEEAFAEAPELYEDAIEQLERAQQAADRNARESIEVQLQSARGAYGRSLATMARLREGYRNLLLGVAEAVNEVLPEEASRMSELAESAAAEARERLADAVAELEEKLEPAEARGDTDTQRALLQHLIGLNESLHSLTNEPQYQNRASEHRNALREL